MGVNLGPPPPLLACVECGYQTGGRVQCVQCNGYVSICTNCLGNSKINWETINKLTCHQSLCIRCNRDVMIDEIVN